MMEVTGRQNGSHLVSKNRIEYHYFRESPSQDWNHQFPKNRVSQNKLWKATKNTQNIFDHCPKIKKHMWTSPKKNTRHTNNATEFPQKKRTNLGKIPEKPSARGPGLFRPPSPEAGCGHGHQRWPLQCYGGSLGGWDLPRCTCTFGAGGAVGGCWTVGMGMLGITSPEMVIEYDGLGDFMQFSWLWMGFHAI